MKQFNLCFLGFGNVGRALVGLLEEKRDELRERYGIEWRITGIATRRLGWLVAPNGFDVAALLTNVGGANVSSSLPPSNVREWLQAARADVLFETTSLEAQTGQPAIEHIRAALEHGAHAITANKGAVIHGYNELSALAQARGLHFMFESTVADCLPAFSLFRECLPAAHLLGFRGVLNSTTSVILEELEAGRSFAEGVRRAQSLGITETDPSYDVDGWDAAVKVCALARVLMNAPLKLNEIRREGIRNLDAETIRAARAANKSFKLVAQATLTDDRKIVAQVSPEQLASNDPLSNASGTTLMIDFKLDVLAGLTMTARNPNLKSTAYGMLADFINAVNE
jgi:homoserine dehydrogenase